MNEDNMNLTITLTAILSVNYIAVSGSGGSVEKERRLPEKVSSINRAANGAAALRGAPAKKAPQASVIER